MRAASSSARELTEARSRVMAGTPLGTHAGLRPAAYSGWWGRIRAYKPAAPARESNPSLAPRAGRSSGHLQLGQQLAAGVLLDGVQVVGLQAALVGLAQGLDGAVAVVGG